MESGLFLLSPKGCSVEIVVVVVVVVAGVGVGVVERWTEQLERWLVIVKMNVNIIITFALSGFIL